MLQKCEFEGKQNNKECFKNLCSYLLHAVQPTQIITLKPDHNWLTSSNKALHDELTARSSSQENPSVEPDVPSPLLFSVLSHMNKSHILQNYFPEFSFNIIIPYTVLSAEWPLPFKLSNQNLVRTSHFLHARYMHHISHPP